MNRSAAIYEKISDLEKELQQLKLEAYFSLPRKTRVNSPYAERSLLRAVKNTRNKIWQNRYAKKVS